MGPRTSTNLNLLPTASQGPAQSCRRAEYCGNQIPFSAWAADKNRRKVEQKGLASRLASRDVLASPQPFPNVFIELGITVLFCVSVHLRLQHRLIPFDSPRPCEFQGQVEPRAWYPYFADNSNSLQVFLLSKYYASSTLKSSQQVGFPMPTLQTRKHRGWGREMTCQEVVWPGVSFS